MPHAPSPEPASLTERKRLRARQRIIDAADELFSSRGFDNVSVTDIAARAEVGRTSFFRYFGDKTEVVFAKEEAMLATVATAGSDDVAPAAHSCAEALAQLRPVVLEVCRQAATDPDGYQRHTDLIERHPELRAREALKAQQIGTSLSDLLMARGTEEGVAVLAAQIALACYATGRQRTSGADCLLRETEAAFDQALSIGAPTTRIG